MFSYSNPNRGHANRFPFGWRSRRSLLVFALAVTAVLGSVPEATAQTITVPQIGIDRTGPRRGEAQFPFWVNYEDCIEENNLTFDVQFRNFTPGANFEVWADAASCVDRMRRTGQNPQCWRVHQSGPTDARTTVEIEARQLVAQRRPNTSNQGEPFDESVCERSGQPLGNPLVLTFMFVNADDTAAGEATLWNPDTNKLQVGFDVVGPTAPRDVQAGVGENSVVLTWDPMSSQTADLLGFRFYCAAASGGTNGTNAATRFQLLDGSLVGADATSPIVPPPASSDAGSVLSPALDDGGAVPSNGGGTINPECPSEAIQAGVRPDEDFFCGSVSSTSATRGNAKGLMNGVTYAVAVAARDQRGNVGELSSVVCNTPQVVEDFFERYRAAGGQGGGGFCSIGATTTPGVGLWFGAAALGAIARRRRKNRSRSPARP